MDSQKRFGQIEEILSDMLAKQDEHTAQINQLSKSVGQVLEVALDAKDIATESRNIAIESRDIAVRVERKADSTANAVAKLTVDMQRGFAQVDENFTHVNGRIDQVNGRFDELMSFLKDKLG